MADWLCFYCGILAFIDLTLTVPMRQISSRDGRMDPMALGKMSRYRLNQHWFPVQSVVHQEHQWPEMNVPLGEVSGVDVTSNGDVIVLHRGERTWKADTFNGVNELNPAQRVPILEDTIVRLDGKDGRFIESFGSNLFYLPHGLTVDDNDNIWITDLGSHQVHFLPKHSRHPTIILGDKFVPGKDDHHFCKPTDVAVSRDEQVFVADGYCNSRIMKYDKQGNLLGKFGMEQMGVGLDSPYRLNIPHGLALVESLDIICVADRENKRALCFNAGLNGAKFGQFNRTLVPGGDIGKVYALGYDPNNSLFHVAALSSQLPFQTTEFTYNPDRIFTFDLDGNNLGGWGYVTEEPTSSPSIPHDIAVSPSGTEVYLADITHRAVRKFTIIARREK